MRKFVLVSFCLLFSRIIIAQSIPSNDECSGAITLTVNSGSSCTNVYSGNTGYSTQSLASCIASGYDARDVWFKFTATAASQRVTVTPLSIDDYAFQVYSGSCANLTSLACVNTGQLSEPDVTVLNNLVVGNTYYLRVYDYYGGGSPTRQFSICISTTASAVNNDDCSGALTVTPSEDENYGYYASSNNTGATQSMIGCYGTAEDDVWFKFTATAKRHRIKVTTNSLINPVLEVFSGSCSSLQSMTCRYTNNGSPYDYVDADLTNLTPGATYYYRVYGSGSNNTRTSIYTTISTPPAPPSNDECSGALTLTVNADNSCSNVYSGNAGYPTQGFASCVASGYDARDVWFKFTATATSHRITVTPIYYDNFTFQVYSGSCANLTSLACVNTGALGEPDITVLNNLVVGNTYYLRVFDYYGGGSPSLEFRICVSTTATVVNNDDCIGALTVTPSVDANFGPAVTVNNTGATQSMAGCYGSAEDDIWFKFTATASRHTIRVYTNNAINPELEVFRGTCSSLQSMGCRYINNGISSDFIDADLTNLTAGATYYYRIYGSSNNNVRTNISTNVSTPPAPPSNDECSGALALTVNAGSSCTNVYSGNTGYSTQSLASCVASGYDARDVWFKFTATAPSHRITVTPLSYDDYVFEVFNGTCDNKISLACVNTGISSEPDVTVLNNLVVGNTYYLRVYDYYGGGSPTRQFSICISTTASAVNNDDCSGALTVTPSEDENYGTSIASNNTGATQSIAGCYGTAEDDVWFKFTATASRHRINVSTNVDINPVLEVFSGSCSSLQSMTCRYTNNGGAYNYVDADLTNLTPGATYYYRVYGSGSSNDRTNVFTSISSHPGGVLPITMASFIVQPKNSSNSLIWETYTEQNNSGFEVQYSRDGNQFYFLKFIPSKANSGNSTNKLSYSYEHHLSGFSEGKIYYRLKQIDYDGHYTLSNVVSIAITSCQTVALLSNLVSNTLNLQIPKSKEYKFIITDYLGRIHKQGVLQNSSINITVLRPGAYLLRLFSNDSQSVLKFIKQ